MLDAVDADLAIYLDQLDKEEAEEEEIERRVQNEYLTGEGFDAGFIEDALSGMPAQIVSGFEQATIGYSIEPEDEVARRLGERVLNWLRVYAYTRAELDLMRERER
jgi:hypothetical protein